MTTPRLAAAIEAEEGRRHNAYLDTLGVPTVGIGHTGPEVHLGLTWTDEQINAAFSADVAKVEAELDRAVPWWRDLSPERGDVLVQMGFQLGVRGLLAFHRTLAAMQAGDFAGAATGMIASLWARQTPARAHRLAELMRTGAYPE